MSPTRRQIEEHLTSILQTHGEDAASIVAGQRATIDAILNDSYDGDYISLHTMATVDIHPSRLSDGTWASSSLMRLAPDAFRSHMSSTSLLHKACHRILEALTIDRYFLAYAFLSADHEPTKDRLRNNMYRAIADAYCVLGADRVFLHLKDNYDMAKMHRVRDNSIKLFSLDVDKDALLKECPKSWQYVAYELPFVPTPKTWVSYSALDNGNRFLSREVSISEELRNHMKFARDASGDAAVFDIQAAMWTTHMPNMVLELDHYVVLDGRAWRPMLLTGMQWQRRRATSSDSMMIKLFHDWWTNGRTMDAWSDEDVKAALSDAAFAGPIADDDDDDGDNDLKTHLLRKIHDTYMTRVDDDVVNLLKQNDGTLTYDPEKDAVVPLVAVTNVDKMLPVYDDTVRAWFLYSLKMPIGASQLVTRALLEVGSPDILARLNESVTDKVRKERDVQRRLEQTQNDELKAQEYRENHPRRARKTVNYVDAAASRPVVIDGDAETSSSEEEDDDEYENDDSDASDDSDDSDADDFYDDSEELASKQGGKLPKAKLPKAKASKASKASKAKAPAARKGGARPSSMGKLPSSGEVSKDREAPVYRARLDRIRKKQSNNVVINLYDVVGWDPTMGDRMHVQLSVGKERVNIRFDDMENAEDFVDYASQPVEMIVQYDNIIHSIPLLYRPAPTTASAPTSVANASDPLDDDVFDDGLKAVRPLATYSGSSPGSASKKPVDGSALEDLEDLENLEDLEDTSDDDAKPPDADESTTYDALDSDDFADLFDDDDADDLDFATQTVQEEDIVFPAFEDADAVEAAPETSVPEGDDAETSAQGEGASPPEEDEWTAILDDDMVMQGVLSDVAFIDMLGSFMESRSDAVFTAAIFDAFESTDATVPRIFDLADTLLLHMLDSANMERPVVLSFRLQDGREVALPSLGSRTKILGSRGGRAPPPRAPSSSGASPASSRKPSKQRQPKKMADPSKGGAVALPATAAPVKISAGGTLSLAKDFTQVRMWADDLMQLQPFLRSIHRSLRIQRNWYNEMQTQFAQYQAAQKAADEAVQANADDADELVKTAAQLKARTWYLVNIPTIPTEVGPDYADGVPVVYKPATARANSGYGAMAGITFVPKQTDQRGENAWRARHGSFMDPATANLFANLLELQPFAFKKVRQGTRALIDQLFPPALLMVDNGRKITIRRTEGEWELLLDGKVVPVFWGNHSNLKDGIDGTLEVPKRPAVGYDVRVRLSGGGTYSFPNPYSISAKMSRTEFENAVASAVNSISGSNVPFVSPPAGSDGEEEDDGSLLPMPVAPPVDEVPTSGDADDEVEPPLSQLSDDDFEYKVAEARILEESEAAARTLLLRGGATPRQMVVLADVPIEYMLKVDAPPDKLLDALAEKEGGGDDNRVQFWIEKGLPSKHLADVALSDAELAWLADYDIVLPRKKEAAPFVDASDDDL